MRPVSALKQKLRRARKRREAKLCSPEVAEVLDRLFVSGPDYAERFDPRVIAFLVSEGLVDTGLHKGRPAARLSGEGVYYCGGEWPE